MTLHFDPEGYETSTLFSLPLAWKGASMLEVGSGDGRLTWRYADKVARVVALEPDAEDFAVSLEACPHEMRHVQFLNLGLEDFYHTNREKFDIALLSWSL